MRKKYSLIAVVIGMTLDIVVDAIDDVSRGDSDNTIQNPVDAKRISARQRCRFSRIDLFTVAGLYALEDINGAITVA